MHGSHFNAEGKFQSDKSPTCPPGKVPLSITDKTAQDLLWEYARRRRTVDAGFSDDLHTALRDAGFAATDSEAWIILFEDQSRPQELFSGAGATDAALRRFDQVRLAWTCHLFRRIAEG